MDNAMQIGARAGIVLLLSFAVSTLSLPIESDAGQDRSKAHARVVSVISADTYDRVLDIVFPRRDIATSDQHAEWSLVLRFKPSFVRESQIVITKRAKKSTVVEYTPVDGSIYGSLNSMLDHNVTEDAMAMSKAIRVTRKEFDISPAQVRRWYGGFFESFAPASKALREAGEEFEKTGRESFVLDGTTYNIWYEQLLSDVSFTLYDVEVDKPGAMEKFKLVRWMNAVRTDIQRRKEN